MTPYGDSRPTCGVCGEWIDAFERGSILIGRCEKHQGRNPCAIEGCKRTRAAPDREGGGYHYGDNQWLCHDHWRRYVPPRSRMRRAYHAHFRRAKRQGWTDANRIAFWRFWNQLVRVARLRAGEGHIDKAEIDRLMGW